MWWRERERDENRAYRENTEVRTECYSEIIELHVLSCCVDTPRAWSERAWRVRGAYFIRRVAVRTLCRCRLSDRVGELPTKMTLSDHDDATQVLRVRSALPSTLHALIYKCSSSSCSPGCPRPAASL